MTKVSYFLLDELPMVDDLVVGGIYYLNDGSQYIVKRDKSLLEVGKVAEDEIKYDQSVRFDNLPSYFTAKKTVTSFSRASSGATGFLGHLENNYRLNNIEYSSNMIVSVETDRLRRGGGEESVVQTITLKYYSTLNDPWGEDVLQSIGKLVRVKVPGADRFRDMGLFPVNLYLKDMPASGLDGAYYGINGATIYISSTDSKYVCVSELQSGFSSKWKKMINPTVLDVTDAPTPPEGEDFVYSAESVKNMVDNHSNLIASETTLGHVRIDGSTIVIDADGVISSVGGTSEPVLLNYDIGLDLTVEELPQGYTLCYLSETNVAEEKDMWVQWIGELTYWAYPMENYTLSIYTINNGNEVSQKVEIGMYYVDENDNTHTGLMGTLYRTANIENGYSEPTITLSSIVGSEPIPENKIYAFKGVTYGSTSESVKFFKDSEYTDIISNTDWEDVSSDNLVHFESDDYFNVNSYKTGITIQSPPIDYDNELYRSARHLMEEALNYPISTDDNFYFTISTSKVRPINGDEDGYDVFQEVNVKYKDSHNNYPQFHYNILKIFRRGNSFTGQWDTISSELPTLKMGSTPKEWHYALNGTLWIDPNGSIYQQSTDMGYIGSDWIKLKTTPSDFEADIVDNLTTDDNTKSLSARQGKVLKDELDEHSELKARDNKLGHVKIKDKSLLINEAGELKVHSPIQYGELAYSHRPLEFNNGLTFRLPIKNGASTLAMEYLSALNQVLGTEYKFQQVRIQSEVLKRDSSVNDSHRNAYQVIKYLSNDDDIRVLAIGERMSDKDDEWLDLSIHLPLNSGHGSPNELNIKAMIGTLYTDNITGKIYIKKGSTSVIDSNNWVEVGNNDVGLVKSINGELPDINGNVELQIPEVTSELTSQRTDVALSAFAGDALREMTYEVEQEIGNHRYDKASNEDLGHVKVDGVTIVADENGVIRTTYDSSAPFRYRSVESVGLEVGDLREYEITPDISMVIKRTIRNGHVSISLKSTHGVELTGLDIQWRATTTYNLDDGVLGADEVKVIDTGVYVNNTEYPAFMIRYNDRMFRGDVMISGYLTTNKFFVFSEEL